AYKAFIHADALTGNVPAQQAEFEQVVSENAERALALDNTVACPVPLPKVTICIDPSFPRLWYCVV
ncbi:MAG: hypothetical protein V3R80_11480, partial [Candidatus Tectomicrobia bacterium]